MIIHAKVVYSALSDLGYFKEIVLSDEIFACRQRLKNFRKAKPKKTSSLNEIRRAKHRKMFFLLFTTFRTTIMILSNQSKQLFIKNNRTKCRLKGLTSLEYWD